MKIACLRIVLRHVPVLQLHVHVQAQVMIRLETILREMERLIQQVQLYGCNAGYW